MFQERIREYYESLTPGFRRLADFILNSTLEAAFLTATELARRVDVDPATVVRFSQEIGYSGYRELSREVKAYVRDQITATSRQAREATDEAALLDGLYASVQQSMQHFMATEKPKLAEIVKALGEAQQVWVIGEGISFDLANFFSKLLESAGISSGVFYPGMVEASRWLSRMREGDVLLTLALGNSGVDSGYTVHQAKEKGVRTLCLCGSDVALPARESDLSVALPVHGPHGIPSFASAGLILALLWEALASRDPEKTQAMFADIESTLKAFLILRAQTEEYDVALS